MKLAVKVYVFVKNCFAPCVPCTLSKFLSDFSFYFCSVFSVDNFEREIVEASQFHEKEFTLWQEAMHSPSGLPE